MKTTITCLAWRPLVRNTLLGFAQIEIGELRLKIHDVAVHTKNGRKWAALPAKPQIRDGTLVFGEDGKLQYFPIMEFDGREVRDAFSNAVCAAVLRHEPRAFDENVPERPTPRQRADVDSDTPF